MILQNMVVLFVLLPLMLLTFWWFLRLLNYSTGMDLQKVLKTIYADPIAAAIYRAAVILACAWLVTAGYSRFV